MMSIGERQFQIGFFRARNTRFKPRFQTKHFPSKEMEANDIGISASFISSLGSRHTSTDMPRKANARLHDPAL